MQQNLKFAFAIFRSFLPKLHYHLDYLSLVSLLFTSSVGLLLQVMGREQYDRFRLTLFRLDLLGWEHQTTGKWALAILLVTYGKKGRKLQDCKKKKKEKENYM